MLVFLVAVILALAIALGVLAGRNTLNASEYAAASNGQGTKPKKTCSSPYKQDVSLPSDPSVFQDLSPSEYHSVRDYLMKQTSLNLTQHTKARQDTNFIFLIELYLPNKDQVLAFLDSKGPKPARRARAMIVNGAKSVPDVEDFLVGPLPNPTSHAKLRLAYRREKMPFSSRPSTEHEENNIAKLLRKVTSECYKILKESFGLWYGNCTNTCLRHYIDGTPASFRNGARKTWVTLFKDREGFDVLPIPFEVLVDHADSDTSKWNVDQVSPPPPLRALSFSRCSESSLLSTGVITLPSISVEKGNSGDIEFACTFPSLFLFR